MVMAYSAVNMIATSADTPVSMSTILPNPEPVPLFSSCSPVMVRMVLMAAILKWLLLPVLRGVCSPYHLPGMLTMLICRPQC